MILFSRGWSPVNISCQNQAFLHNNSPEENFYPPIGIKSFRELYLKRESIGYSLRVMRTWGRSLNKLDKKKDLMFFSIETDHKKLVTYNRFHHIHRNLVVDFGSSIRLYYLDNFDV
jgi:hypothetical protein